MNLTDQVIQSYAKAIEAASHELTANLQDEAEKRGWPDKQARSLRVKVSDRVEVEYDSDAADLEFGSWNSAPKPAVRSFRNQSPEGVVLSHLGDELRKRGVC